MSAKKPEKKDNHLDIPETVIEEFKKIRSITENYPDLTPDNVSTVLDIIPSMLDNMFPSTDKARKERNAFVRNIEEVIRSIRILLENEEIDVVEETKEQIKKVINNAKKLEVSENYPDNVARFVIEKSLENVLETLSMLETSSNPEISKAALALKNIKRYLSKEEVAREELGVEKIDLPLPSKPKKKRAKGRKKKMANGGS